MQHKTIIATCAAMAAFSGMATADIQLPLDVLNANNGGKTFSAQLGAGYATKYISRGLSVDSLDTERLWIMVWNTMIPAFATKARPF